MTEPGLAAWLQRLESLHPKAIDLGLERVRTVAARLELIPQSIPVVTVAGTNGKGTTATALEALLLQAGYRPGVTTSPHLMRFNERIRVAGEEAGDDAIVSAFEAIDAARGELSLTYFEFGVLAALWVFRAESADILVLEVGLGGRLDAVNIVDPTVAVITRLGMDHQAWLGDSLDQIAREKAGILRRDGLAVIADPAPPPGLIAAVAEVGARPVFLGRDFSCMDAPPDAWRPQLVDADGGQHLLQALPRDGLVSDNLCAALEALLLLGIDVTRLDLGESLGSLSLPGRRQTLTTAGIHYLLDVAHNPQAVDKMLEYLQLSPCQGKTIALFSVMEDKPIRAMIQALRGVFAAWFLADQGDNARAAAAADIASLLREEGEHMISVSKNLRQALRRAQSIMASGDRLVVFGSFTTVAGVLPALEKDIDRLDP